MGERHGPLVARAVVPAAQPEADRRLAEALGIGPFALVMLFLAPEADLAAVTAGMARACPGARVVGCTTAGEISDIGYDEGTIVALAFAASHFAAETLVIPDLSRLVPRDLITAMVRARVALAEDHAHLPEELALLLVDGLSVKEDELASALAAGTGIMPLVGGSAGDGIRFHETFVTEGGRIYRDAAVLTLIRSACPVRVFNLDHLVPTDQRMVVTRADASARIVQEFNAEPAAREYARLLGKEAGRMDALTFAAHPLTVRMGARHHVRAIQRVLPSGDLVFFSAIDEGVVLTVAEPQDMAAHLERELDRLAAPGRPEAILAFDCILRRIEARDKQMTGRISALLRRHGVAGFSTYGEQIGPLHVNHTMTGLAFYPPGTRLPETAP